MTLPSWASPRSPAQELLLLLRQFAGPFGKFAERPAERRSAPSGHDEVEEIHQGTVLTLEQAELPAPA